MDARAAFIGTNLKASLRQVKNTNGKKTHALIDHMKSVTRPCSDALVYFRTSVTMVGLRFRVQSRLRGLQGDLCAFSLHAGWVKAGRSGI